jgi:hypothetical protein
MSEYGLPWTKGRKKVETRHPRSCEKKTVTRPIPVVILALWMSYHILEYSRRLAIGKQAQVSIVVVDEGVASFDITALYVLFFQAPRGHGLSGQWAQSI